MVLIDDQHPVQEFPAQGAVACGLLLILHGLYRCKVLEPFVYVNNPQVGPVPSPPVTTPETPGALAHVIADAGAFANAFANVTPSPSRARRTRTARPAPPRSRA